MSPKTKTTIVAQNQKADTQLRARKFRRTDENVPETAAHRIGRNEN